MANIRDVAKRAGVSPATVSRVLNNNQTYKITNETRENVLRAVTELGYTPLIKKSDRSEREAVDQRFSIGCLLATTRGKYRDPYYLSLLSGIEDEMEKQGGVVSLIHTEQELEDPEILNRTLEAGLDGLVSAGWRWSIYMEKDTGRSGLSAAAHGTSPCGAPAGTAATWRR